MVPTQIIENCSSERYCCCTF